MNKIPDYYKGIRYGYEARKVIEDFEPPQEVVSLLARRKEESNNSLLERT
jgi:hypothetical protein